MYVYGHLICKHMHVQNIRMHIHMYIRVHMYSAYVRNMFSKPPQVSHGMKQHGFYTELNSEGCFQINCQMEPRGRVLMNLG